MSGFEDADNFEYVYPNQGASESRRRVPVPITHQGNAQGRGDPWAYSDQLGDGEQVIDTRVIDRKRRFDQAFDRWEPLSFQLSGASEGTTTHSQRVEERIEQRGPEEPSAPPRPWSRELHRRFVKAIYDIGVGHASPSVILEHMTLQFPKDKEEASKKPQLTSERVKSHLQKYRKNKQKSTNEFMEGYDQWLQKALNVVGGVDVASRTSIATNPYSALQMMEDPKRASQPAGPRMPLGGEAAAYVSFAVMLEDKSSSHVQQVKPRTLSGSFFPTVRHRNDTGSVKTPVSLPRGSFPTPKLLDLLSTGAKVEAPVLTEEERKSTLGVSISHVLGLFHSMRHHIVERRIAQVEEDNYTLARPPHQLDRYEDPKIQAPVSLETNSEYPVSEPSVQYGNASQPSFNSDDSCSTIHDVLVPDPPETGLFAASQVPSRMHHFYSSEQPSEDYPYNDPNLQYGNSSRPSFKDG